MFEWIKAKAEEAKTWAEEKVLEAQQGFEEFCETPNLNPTEHQDPFTMGYGDAFRQFGRTCAAMCPELDAVRAEEERKKTLEEKAKASYYDIKTRYNI